MACLAAVALTPLGVGACETDDWTPDELLGGAVTTQHERLVERGRDRYSQYCAGCHGESGDGNGPAAKFLEPKPRDLRVGKVKFAAVPSGQPPRDIDLIRTIERGLHGTSMPSWELLPLDDKQAIVAYIRTLSPAWSKPPARPVAIKDDPWKKWPAQGVAEGERVYHGLASCTGCHPAYVPFATIDEYRRAADLAPGHRDDPYRSMATESEWVGPSVPPDFLLDRTKRASKREELVEVIAAGVGGTAMPSWGEALDARQLWGLAYYVESLIAMRGTTEARAKKEALLAQEQGANR